MLYALSDGHTLAFFAPDLREPGKTYQYTFERSYAHNHCLQEAHKSPQRTNSDFEKISVEFV